MGSIVYSSLGFQLSNSSIDYNGLLNGNLYLIYPISFKSLRIDFYIFISPSIYIFNSLSLTNLIYKFLVIPVNAFKLLLLPKNIPILFDV